MTTETMNLQELLERTADADFLREMIGCTAQRLMDVEVEALTGAAPGVRSPGRVNQRNGYRDRTWETRAGTIDLRIPKLRKSLPLRKRGALLPGFPGAAAVGREGPDRRQQGAHQLARLLVLFKGGFGERRFHARLQPKGKTVPLGRD
jgi:hypothetical protein